MIRVAIVTDNRLLCEGLERIVVSEPSLLVVAAVDRETLLKKPLGQASPDVVLLDSRLHGALPLCAEWRRQGPRPSAILLGADMDPDWAADALQAGARGVLGEQAGSQEMMKAICVVHDGQIWVLKRVVSRIVDRMTVLADAARVHQARLAQRLSRRELDIVRHVASGESNHEIADRLAISEATVKAHLTRIFQKFALRSRAQLAALYHRSLPRSQDA